MIPDNTIACSSNRENYINQALELYRCAPGTLGRVRREDRLFAADLHDRGIHLSILETAFVLAAARRCLRSPDALPLAPIRSMHYFLPVIEEVLANPPAADYLAYLKSRIKQHAAPHTKSLR
jgi:hypothetical protein